jgi:4-hydroxybenzoate polyprenyltransferase
MMEGIGMNGLVLGSREKKSVLIKQPGSRSWISILEAISADGRVLPSTVIFKGKTVQQQQFPQNLDFLDDWNFTCSEKGWTNNQIALIWLKMVFIPLTKPDNPREPRLLILDGHGSHMTEDFLFECYDNNVFLLFLPAHTSHVLQPLDVAVFGPLKNAYRRFISDLATIADSSQIGKISFLYNYHKARKEAITKNNIYAGFKAAGLWPLNVAKALMNPMVTETPIPAVIPISHTNEQYNSLLETPRSSTQFRRALEAIPASVTKDPTVRLLFRKIGTQLDRQGIQIEEAIREITLLKYQNEELQPKRSEKSPIMEMPNSQRFQR